MLKSYVCATNLNELKCCQKESSDILTELCQKRVGSYEKHLVEEIQNKFAILVFLKWLKIQLHFIYIVPITTTVAWKRFLL